MKIESDRRSWGRKLYRELRRDGVWIHPLRTKKGNPNLRAYKRWMRKKKAKSGCGKSGGQKG